MMMGKEDLGLNLSLSFPRNHQSLKPNLFPSSADFCSSTRFVAFKKSSWNDFSPPSDPARLFLKGIDVNRLPSTINCEEEEVVVSSPNSTVSNVSGKRSERECSNGENLRGISDEEDGDTSRKKLRLSKDQSAILEDSFKEHNNLDLKEKLALAKQLGLRPRQVEVWFQNRRARTKMKQTEVDCDFLKRYCENLTEENRRLQKEVQELRALKLSPQFYMQMTPPTTLTMCPSCESVAGKHNASSTVDPWSHQLAQAQSRSIPNNRWAPATPMSHVPFDALRP